jgi:hypothetical protein
VLLCYLCRPTLMSWPMCQSPWFPAQPQLRLHRHEPGQLHDSRRSKQQPTTIISPSVLDMRALSMLLAYVLLHSISVLEEM